MDSPRLENSGVNRVRLRGVAWKHLPLTHFVEIKMSDQGSIVAETLSAKRAKCSVIRESTISSNLLKKINLGTAEPADLHKLEELGRMMKTTCACGLGMTAANPVLTYLHEFEEAAMATG